MARNEEEEGRAPEYILKRFAQFGLEDVRSEEFQYLRYFPKRCNLEITGSPKKKQSIINTGVLPKMEWWKPRLFMRGKAREEFRALYKLGVKLQGKIVVVSSFAPGWRFT